MQQYAPNGNSYGNLSHSAVNSHVILWLNLLHLAVKWLYIGVALCCTLQSTLLHLAELMVPHISQATTTRMCILLHSSTCMPAQSNKIPCCILLHLVSTMLHSDVFGRVCRWSDPMGGCSSSGPNFTKLVMHTNLLSTENYCLAKKVNSQNTIHLPFPPTIFN